MPISSSAETGLYEPTPVPEQTYQRYEYSESKPVKVHTDVDKLASVTEKKSPWLKIILIAGLIAFVGVAAAAALAVVFTRVVTTTTSSNTIATTAISSSNSVSSSSSTVSTASTTSVTTTVVTTTGVTTSACPSNTCVFSTSYTMLASGYYGTERVNINCSQTLSNFTATIVVQRTVNASYGSQFNTFWSGVIQQSYTTTSSQIIYQWNTISGQTVSGTGFPYYFEAQYQLIGTNQTVSGDTYSVTVTFACNGLAATYTGIL